MMIVNTGSGNGLVLSGTWSHDDALQSHTHITHISLGWHELTPPESSPPEQNGRHFADNVFRCIFVNEKSYILIKIALKFAAEGPISNNEALV